MAKTLRKIGRIISAKLLPKIPYPILVGPMKGVKFVLGSLSGLGGGASVYFNLVEQKQSREFVRCLKKNGNDIVFDIGANAGYYSILASKVIGKNGTIIAFEPVVRNLYYLFKHVELNKLDNILILPFACSDTSSFGVFSFGRNSAEGHLLHDNSLRGLDRFTQTFVGIIAIDHFVNSTGILPSVMKIDVEGAELSVLQGAEKTIRAAKPKIFLSIHTSILETECIKYLSGIGYKYVLLYDKDRPSVEYLFY